MKKSRSYVLGAAAVIGAALATTGASGARASPLQNPTTTVTFTVTSGALTINAPLGVALVPGTGDSGLPGTSVAGTMGDTVVTDNRAALLTPWIATVSESPFTTGAGSLAQTISAGAATYDPGTVATTGDITATGSTVTLSGSNQQVVTDAGSGDNTATWDATITLAIPATAVVGDYTGTLTSSVG